MKSVLISIQPKWCELIASGKKTVEVRKTKPKLETPFKVYIYCTKGETVYLPRDIFGNKALNGKVIGEFVCDQIDEIGYSPEMHGKYISDIDDIHYVSCIDFEQMFEYLADRYGYAWHISDLEIYDKPRELREFYTQCKEYPKTGTIDTPKKCRKCKYQYTWNLASKCRIDGTMPIKRPPQSWCYVESEGEYWTRLKYTTKLLKTSPRG